MLVSVHLPKTAGTSFLLTLEAHFGQRLLKDYGDRPINKSSFRRNSHALSCCVRNGFARKVSEQVDCIHGHFLPLKYRFLPSAQGKQFVIWLRDPLERMVSHYHYWQRSFEPDSAAELHRQMVEESWSLERFCLGPELQNIYSKFLWGFPLGRFSFIGITEHYESDVRYFTRQFLQASLGPEKANVSPVGQPVTDLDDPAFRERVAAHHSVDMALYRQALALREARVSQGSPERYR